MDLLNTEFKRKFSLTLYKNLKLSLGQMSFYKDFVNDKRGDLYPILSKTDDCTESVERNIYSTRGGEVRRRAFQFFPYATYELNARVECGSVGFAFILPNVSASLLVSNERLTFSCGERTEEKPLPDYVSDDITLVVSCRPSAFDVYFETNGKPEYYCSFKDESFNDSNLYQSFTNGSVALCVEGEIEVEHVLSYIDSGISLADYRPIRYENGEIMVENGKIYFTASIRMQEEMFQGIFSLIPSTAELELCGALFYDSGDGKWCGDVAVSMLYHRAEKKWLLWVCSFAHDHVLGHAEFEGDVRFGVNVVDITLMQKAPEGADRTEFLGFSGDEDPDFFYDAKADRWLMAICRLDTNRAYRYMFFESKSPFEGYRFIGKGLEGAETGGSFVKVDGKQLFVCGNDFKKTSDYRIYSADGMINAKFDFCDGGFRGWGTLMPIKMGTRTRYFWITFDRHNGSSYNWSYGNFYCFEAQ